MKGGHIAIFTQLGNGHVYPVLPLSAELVRRGYRVTYASNERYASTISATGAEPIEFDVMPLSAQSQEELQRKYARPCDDPLWWEESPEWSAENFSRISATVSKLQRFYEENVPDIVLYDRYFPAARIIAARVGAPTIQMSAHFAYYKSFVIRENGVCRNPEPVVRQAREMDAFLAAYGITSKDNLWHVEELNIHFIPKYFQHHSEYFDDDRFCFVGAHLDRPFQRRAWEPIDDMKLILISGLSGPDFAQLVDEKYFGVLADALADCGRRCILSVGDNFPKESRRFLPDNFELNRNVSHLQILPHAALSICHGGMLSTLEALYNGVPVLQIPVHPFCDEIAYRTEELGLGKHLSRATLTAENIARTVKDMLGNAALGARVKTARALFRQSGGVAIAADKIDAVVDGL